ncbi:hypothetical protein C8D78_2836 [Arthrobacter oryzae]|uniref:Uncharacterized protein n=2 Tax=Arthrobacter oryzae TaxID=409290 RepID=A0A495EPS1_9MICC|nr:hypothetical protein C8D78_2836 [Arthrobacter oryzae]
MLDLDEMAAAIDRRLTSSWADKDTHLVTTMRAAHPEELSAARALVKLHLGSQRQWRLKAEVVRNNRLAATMRRRRSSGSAREVFILRAILMAGLIALPSYIVVTDREDVLKLVLVGIACIAVAMTGGHYITIHARVPVMPNIRGAWLAEIRDDIIDATLVAILQNNGTALDARTVTAGRRGWVSIQTAAQAMDALHR